MQSNRYNVFNNIHKGLRGMLFTVQQEVQQTDFNSAEAVPVIENLELALRYFDEHAEHEDNFVLNEIVKFEPHIAEELEAEHVTDHQLGETLREYIQAWKNAADKTEAGRQIFYAFNDFIAFNLYHMNKEETVLLQLLWKHFTDEEIIGMEQRILQTIAPEVLVAESRWMLRSLSTPEIIAWYMGMKHGAPAEVFMMFKGLAAEELPKIKMQQLETALA